MTSSISHLNGDQQNKLNHLSKNLKNLVKPVAIICYGHRSTTYVQNSVFTNPATSTKKNTVFDIFLIINDHETLTEPTIKEMIKLNCGKNVTEHLLIFRLNEVISGLKDRNRFFLTVFKKGILLSGSNELLKLLPDSLSVPSLITVKEKRELGCLAAFAQRSIEAVKLNLLDDYLNPRECLINLNAAAVSVLRYYIAGICGIGACEDFKSLLEFSTGINDKLKRFFPANTPEEIIFMEIMNLSFIDEGFCPDASIIRTLCKRVATMITVSQSVVEQKFSALRLV